MTVMAQEAPATARAGRQGSLYDTINRLQLQRATQDPLVQLIPPPRDPRAALARAVDGLPDGLLAKAPASSKVEK